MDRAQRVDGKNGIICLVMFTPDVMVIKMSTIAHFFCIFCRLQYFLCRLSGFFIFLPSKGYLTPKHINHTIF